MGQKVSPIGFRLGVNKTWDSVWYSNKKDYAKLLKDDRTIRAFLGEKLKAAAISKIVIERPASKCRIFIHTARPGVIIGKKGSEIEVLTKAIQNMVGYEVFINTVEVRKPDTEAQLVAASMAEQLERRVAFRRAMKRAVQSAMRNGVKGIKISTSGRLGGAEIARTEWYLEGSIPLHTLRADIDFGFAEALTTYGIIGIKVWINKGEKLSVEPTKAV